MVFGSQVDRLLRQASRGLDTWVVVRLGLVEVEKHAGLSLAPSDPAAFWRSSRVNDPARITLVDERVAAEGREWHELELVGPSEGPGTHPGSRKLFASAHVRRGQSGAPMVVMVHGFAVPFTGYDRLAAWQLRRRGAHTVRIDLPFHLRRRIPGKPSGASYFSIDLERMRAVVRQSVEDVAAVVAWARQEVTSNIVVFGVSLGGLISSLLAALVEVEGLVAVAPLVDPASSFTERPPVLVQRRMGMLGAGDDFWGRDSRSARHTVEAGLAPIRPRSLTPATPGERITIVRPLRDLIVGPAPMLELAQAWGADLWDYDHGHITIMNAQGFSARVRDRLLTRAPALGHDMQLAG